MGWNKVKWGFGNTVRILSERCIVFLWDLCAFCLTAAVFGVFMELSKLYLLPLLEFGSILSTFVPDQILPGIPH